MKSMENLLRKKKVSANLNTVGELTEKGGTRRIMTREAEGQDGKPRRGGRVENDGEARGGRNGPLHECAKSATLEAMKRNARTASEQEPVQALLDEGAAPSDWPAPSPSSSAAPCPTTSSPPSSASTPPASRPSSPRPTPPPSAPAPPPSFGGLLPGRLLSGLGELDSEDYLLLLILWLLYRESGDFELLIIMAAMYLF